MIEDMSEALMNAVEEMKRADHLLYVSLKYTRTVEVLLSIVQRLINAYDWVWEGLLVDAKEKGKIDDIPPAPRMRVEKIRELYSENEKLMSYLDFYLLLRAINRGSVSRKNEYRRHVTLTSGLPDGRRVDITIDIIGEYFHRTQAFLDLVKQIAYDEKND
ncbi:hypothetical protein D6764_01430 [Candidatus Woesearchaeota archaeon]|nr:MAG: hypothetical protein D6764_01430 [Candidatus Woesearchaeota archaeon]